MIRTVNLWPDPVLLRPAASVSDFGEDLEKLVIDMIDTMRAAKGVGLAAPQVGVPLRVAVIDHPKWPLVLVNPSVLHTAGGRSSEELCLSVPGLAVNLRRASYVKFQAFDVKGQPYVAEKTGHEALIVQHEIGHLEGRLITHYLTPKQRERAKQLVALSKVVRAHA